MFDAAPDDWRIGSLGDLVRESVDRIDPNQEGGAFSHYVGLEHIEQGTGRLSGLGRIADVVSQKSVFLSGDILFGKLRPNLRKVARPDFDGVCSTDIVVFRVKDGADADFAFQLLQSDPLVDHAVATAAGTKMPRTHARSILSFAVALPPLNEQRRIAEVLSSVDKAIAAQSEVCSQTEITFNSVAEACFTSGAETANNVWPIYPLGDLCESIQVGIVVRPASYYVETGGVPALRSLNVGENRLNLDDLVYISAEGHRFNNKSSLRPGDVVTRRTGEPGKTAVIPPTFPDGLNCIDIIFSRPMDKLRAEFLSFFMNSEAAKKQVAGLQGGLAQQHLNVGEMKTLKVPVPIPQVQDEIIETLKSAWDRVEGEKALLDRLMSVRSAIGVELLSGRVRVPA